MSAAKKQDLAEYLFHQGTNYNAYEYLGAHRENDDNIVFRVWAPNANEVFLAGDFNSWGYDTPLCRVSDGGVFEVKVKESVLGENFRYKYIVRSDTKECYKTDPYGYFCQCPPDTASVFYDIDSYEWKDKSYLNYRRRNFSEGFYKKPINIYEVHLGSWKKHEDGSYCNYRELAEELAPYVKQMGYTHIELLPIMEHPFDGSWGYQVGCYYAPSARFGTPKDFMAFVDKMHNAGIGVILDWVPAHFPKDESGLYQFDGGPLYEYSNPLRREHSGWGTCCFDLGRNEVESFLVSNADFWLRKYHIDGLRVDAVSAMLYLDFDRRDGEWERNIYGDNRSLDGEAFFKKLNGHIKGVFSDVLMIAEESGNYNNVTKDVKSGLGFSMKWDMGWMNDTLSYMSMDPIYRKYHHDKLTFSMMYAFNEKYTMPISHDEVVHGKKSLIDRMPGEYEQKFAQVRCFMGYMMTHPGKKLMFMGNEIGQFKEWDYKGQVEWFLLDYEMHAKLQRYFSTINHFYLENKELWENDENWEGFKWICADNRDESVISYRRISRANENRAKTKSSMQKELIAVVNFTPVCREEFLLCVPKLADYVEVFNSDAEDFGGSGIKNEGKIRAFKVDNNSLPYGIKIKLPPFSFLAFRKAKRSLKKISQ